MKYDFIIFFKKAMIINNFLNLKTNSVNDFLNKNTSLRAGLRDVKYDFVINSLFINLFKYTS